MKIVTGIASSTHVDLHGERVSKENLDLFVEQIHSKYIRSNIEHNENNTIGVVLHGKVVPYSDGEYGLFVVVGHFETKEEKERYKIGQPNEVWEEYVDLIKDVKILQSNGSIAPKINRENIADLLEIHLNSTKISNDGQIYKVKHYIASVGDLRIEVYPKDHFPPHFHVISKQRGLNVRIDLYTLKLLSVKKGKARQKDVRKVQHFFEVYPDKLEKLRRKHREMTS